MDPISGLGAAGVPNFAALRAQQAPAPKIATQELADLGSIGVAQPDRTAPAGGSFAEMLGNMVQEVNAKQAAAGQAVSGVLACENVPLHQAMIAMEEASVSFQLMVEVRNKLVESYQELMRMQI